VPRQKLGHFVDAAPSRGRVAQHDPHLKPNNEPPHGER
jgi:hypothetical protein